MHARGRAHKRLSFASEPIQLPIVPVKPFEPRSLRSTACARERTESAERGRAGPSAPRGIGAGAQHDEVGERAERGRQRAAQLVPRRSAANRRRLPAHRTGVCARVWVVCPTHAVCRCTDQARHPRYRITRVHDTTTHIRACVRVPARAAQVPGCVSVRLSARANARMWSILREVI